MTAHHDGLMEVAEELLATAPDAGPILMACLRRLRQGDLPDQEAVAQLDGRQSYDISDALAYVRVREYMATGILLRARIDVGDGPCADHDIVGNQRILDRLVAPFKARFVPQRGGGADHDGWLQWDGTVRMCRTDLLDDPRYTIVEALDPWKLPLSVPLEVGTTRGSKTLVHIVQRRGVARWPYRSRWIYLWWTPRWLAAEAAVASIARASADSKNTASQTPATLLPSRKKSRR